MEFILPLVQSSFGLKEVRYFTNSLARYFLLGSNLYGFDDEIGIELGRIFIKKAKIFGQEHVDIIMEVEVFPSRSQTIMEHTYLSQIATR